MSIVFPRINSKSLEIIGFCINRLRIATEIQREQEEIEVELRDLEARGVMIEKELRGEEQLPDL